MEEARRDDLFNFDLAGLTKYRSLRDTIESAGAVPNQSFMPAAPFPSGVGAWLAAAQPGSVPAASVPEMLYTAPGSAVRPTARLAVLAGTSPSCAAPVAGGPVSTHALHQGTVAASGDPLVCYANSKIRD